MSTQGIVEQRIENLERRVDQMEEDIRRLKMWVEAFVQAWEEPSSYKPVTTRD